MTHRYKILDIIKGTTVDGPGFRTAIYFAGCRHACPGCHNPQSWDFNAGKDMSLEELMEVIEEEDFDVTLSGGDPLYHPEEIAALAKAIFESGYKVWLYTGFTIEEIQASERLSLPLPFLDAIVEGPYIAALRDPDLPFRGSSNQRIIRNPQTLL
ncbi:MAG: anaerobic ribonucleoside-triphosphate reductase activating protein [Muribaculaceae bacterium]|nr:anaerobic ribonucleoside-triphosphate reductase activating protein [Muribaculaceae bacterium]